MPDENLPNGNVSNDNSGDTEPAKPSISGDVISPSQNEPVAEKSNEVTREPEQAGPLEEPQSEQHQILAIPATTPIKKRSNRKKILVVLLGLLLVVAIAVSAWVFSQNDATNNKSQNNTGQETAEIEELNVGTVEGPASAFFPDEGLLGIYSVLNRQIYEGLVGFEDKTIAPLIAQSWTNPDEKTWVFKIRPNIKFHTGKQVTAAEIKKSLEDLKGFEYWSIFVSTIDSIEATGDLELTIRTTEPDALLLNRLTQAYIRDIDSPDAGGRNGTGAYLADESAVNDDKSTTLVAFDEYYGGRAKTRKLIFTVYENDDMLVKALKDKKIDIAETLTFPAIKKELTDAGFTSTEYDTPGAFGIYLNIARNETTQLNNKDVRLAIAQAIDRQTMVDKVGNKNTPSYQVIPKSLPGHDTSISLPSYDLEDAKATLAKSGYNNEPLDFVYVKELQLEAPIVIEQLKAVGFNITEKAFANADIDKALEELRSGNFDLFTAGYSSDVLDARDVLGSILHSTESTYGNYKDPVYDKMLEDSDKEFDPVKRTQLLQKANNYIADNLIWIPLRNSVYAAYYTKDLDLKIDYVGGGNIGAYYRKTGRIQ